MYRKGSRSIIFKATMKFKRQTIVVKSITSIKISQGMHNLKDVKGVK